MARDFSEFDLDVRLMAADDQSGGGENADMMKQTRMAETCAAGCDAAGIGANVGEGMSGEEGDMMKQTRMIETCAGGCDAAGMGGGAEADMMKQTRLNETCDVCS